MLAYKSGYKYQLTDVISFQTSFRPDKPLVSDYLRLGKTGILTILPGYAWDGCSGPVRDTEKNQHAGLLHDALYNLMRLGLLDHKLWAMADVEFAKQLKLYGVWRVQIWVMMKGLALVKGKHARPQQRKKVTKIETKRAKDSPQ